MWKCIVLGLLLIAGPAAAETKILAFAGSTRADSYNKKLAREAASMARQMGAKVTYIDLRDYPVPNYDGDEEKKGMPENAKRIRDLFLASDGVIIATPEYNGSISAVLKSVIDWASRTEKAGYSNMAFKGRKFAIMSASPGMGGGARALKHLREILEGLGGEVVPTQVTVPKAYEAFDGQGRLLVPSLRNNLRSEVQELLDK